ncbi:LOW QUALITY PROTEIN: hypothetical protein GGTG_07890 [Gaeumannomyces tritici R3-111a-1]|uniref:Uncharacterized protein n=1 Tax=Gaeumannomyces tritici (strain R3-111a-1) TaxID=644352 RepID=J3P2Z9_GAET3|nr:LOW QUALITY PROTEIN: hypothetical protein GGTG_07890 [Gaeumannomyces tritici R3-111a-1]EJT74041.1 LOW QUALITY PROTEIN: hypothetical protein GGTG_07890 [Gaeumannomyces tritici R3-111a-1]
MLGGVGVESEEKEGEFRHEVEKEGRNKEAGRKHGSRERSQPGKSEFPSRQLRSDGYVLGSAEPGGRAGRHPRGFRRAKRVDTRLDYIVA